MMNKLGFAIGVASGGFSIPYDYKCNDGEWSRKIKDMRDVLKTLTGLQNENILTLLSFSEDGSYIVILKKISGREGDYKSCWVYIPDNIVVEADEICKVCSFVKNHLSENDWKDEGCKQEVKGFFDKEYETRNYSLEKTINHGGDKKYGYRWLDKRTNLYDLLTKGNLYQKYYSAYEFIFLLDDSDVKINPNCKGLFADLTDKPIERYVRLLPPANVENGVTIVKDGNPFDKPILVKAGEKVCFVAKREGFKEKPFHYVVKDDEEQTLPVPTFEWKKCITYSMFKVQDKETEEDIYCAISLSGKNLSSTNQEQYLPEKECKNVTVKVEAPKYESFSQDMNLLDKLRKNSVIQILLQKSEETRDIDVELANGEIAHAKLNAKRLPSEGEKLLKGYEPQSRTYKYRGDSGWHWGEFLCGFVAAVALALVVWMIVPMPDSENESALVSDEGETQLDEATKSLFDYLNGCDKWEKSKVDSLAGDKDDYKELYDKMNSYDFGYFTDRISVDSGQCPKLEDIIKVAREAKQNIEMNGEYSKDGSITVSKWIEKVNRKISEAKAKAETEKTSEAQPSERKVADEKTEKPKEHAAPASQKVIKTSSNEGKDNKKVTNENKGNQGTENNGNISM